MVNLGRGTKWALLDNRSAMARRTVFPFATNKPVTKSRAMCDQGCQGMARGWRRPLGCALENLEHVHRIQAATILMVGH